MCTHSLGATLCHSILSQLLLPGRQLDTTRRTHTHNPTSLRLKWHHHYHRHPTLRPPHPLNGAQLTPTPHPINGPNPTPFPCHSSVCPRCVASISRPPNNVLEREKGGEGRWGESNVGVSPNQPTPWWSPLRCKTADARGNYTVLVRRVSCGVFV